eukprot:263837_1
MTVPTQHIQYVTELDTNINTGPVAIAFMVVACVVYIPIILFLAYPLYKARNGMMLQKRHADLTIWGIVALVINIFIVSFCQLLYWHAGSNFNAPKQWFLGLFCASIILLQFVTQFSFTAFNIRLWITYYDIQYSNLIGSNEWKNVIDQNYNINQSFFVKHKRTLGNKKFLKIALWVCCVIVTLISILLSIIDAVNTNSLRNSYMIQFWAFTVACNLWIQIVLCIFMYFKLRKVKYFDDFYVLKEFTAYCAVLLVTVILFMFLLPGIIFIIVLIFPSLQGIEQNDTYIVLASYVAFHSYILFHIIIIYVMTRYIIKKLQNDPSLLQQYGESLKKLSYHHISKDQSKDNQIEMQTDLALNTTDSGKEILVTHILGKQEYIESFMQHLSLEFSEECLLSLIEMIQFRDFVRAQSINMNQVERMSIIQSSSNNSVIHEELINIELPANVPKSSIVFNKINDDRYKAQQLFEKYIAEGSEHEINIGSRLRSKMTDKFQTPAGILRTLSGIGRTIESVGQHKNISGLPFVFDDCCTEMVRLLRYSLSRFKNKPQYLKLEQFENLQKD